MEEKRRARGTQRLCPTAGPPRSLSRVAAWAAAERSAIAMSEAATVSTARERGWEMSGERAELHGLWGVEQNGRDGSGDGECAGQ